MKTYRGERTIDGLKVTVDGTDLDPRFDLKVHEQMGFEWSYTGKAPMQLALAILADFYGSEPDESQVHRFMVDVIANLDNDWALSDEEIRQTISESP